MIAMQKLNGLLLDDVTRVLLTEPVSYVQKNVSAGIQGAFSQCGTQVLKAVSEVERLTKKLKALHGVHQASSAEAAGARIA